jgi:MFS transporter, PHS family, inorganic phosphate transporter
MMVTLVFTMQAAGLIVGPLLAAGLLRASRHKLVARHDLAHPAGGGHRARDVRVLDAPPHGRDATLPVGDRPARRLRRGGFPRAGADRGAAESEWARRRSAGAGARAVLAGFRTLLSNPVFLMRLVGASLAWAAMDFAYYGNTVSSPMVLAAMSPNKSLLNHTLMQLAIFAIAAAPGYLIAAATMDRIGRKSIQMVGFVMMAVAFALIALIPGVEHLAIPFLIIYGVSYFFTEFGPNSTTFVYPAEIFPVRARTTGHGIAAATGKLGGFLGVFLFPIFMAWHGLLAAEGAAAIVSVLGAIVTLTMLPETKGKSLEELSPETPAGASAAARA